MSPREASRAPRPSRHPVADALPDVRDGLTRLQRVILWKLDELREELGREDVPTVMLYGRVVESVDVDEHVFQDALQSLGAGPRVRRLT